MLADHEVRNAFLPPTALKLMRQVERPHDRWNYAMRSIFTGGEAMGAELMDWGRETFGFTLNEGYGQTECNLVVGNCATIMPARAGSMGKPVPGHDVAIIDADGNSDATVWWKVPSPCVHQTRLCSWSIGATRRPPKRNSTANGF